MKKSLSLVMAAIVALFAVVTLTVTAFARSPEAPTTTTAASTSTTTADDPAAADDSSTTSTTKASTTVTEQNADENASTIGDTEWAGQNKPSNTPAADVNANIPATGANGVSVAVFVSLALAAGVAAVVATKKKEA